MSLWAAISSIAVGAGLWYIYDNYLKPGDVEDEWVSGIKQDSKKEEDKGLPMKILYGSQTGTAEGFAMELRKDARKYGFSGQIVDIEDYDVEEIEDETLLVFVVATYGEGDPTDGSEDFYNSIKEAAQEAEEGEPRDSELHYAVFGCGNRQYQFFNQMGKDYDKYLEQLGASRLIPLGLGDDDQNIEDEWLEWRTMFWEKVLPKYRGPDFVIDDTFETSYDTEWMPEDTTRRLPKPQRYECTSRNALESSRIIKVKDRRQLRKNLDDGSTLHIDFDLEKTNIRYKTADNLSLVAPNDEALVNAVIERLGLEPHALFCLKRLDPEDVSPLPVPAGLSVKQVFTWQLDIAGEPKKRFLRDIAMYCSEESEAEALRAMAKEKLPHGEYWNLLKVLEAFPSLNPPMHVLCELLPKHRPRAYTTSSSNRVNPHIVSITIKLDYHQAANGSTFKGVCSRLCDEFKPGSKVRAFVTPSSFRLPKDLSVPVLMIGPGTGIAPFRALLQEGNHLLAKGKKIPGEWHLYFGCRYKDTDFIYQDELLSAHKDQNGCLDELHVAFSREQKEKVYVQDLLRKNGKKVNELIGDKKAKILVCGATAMGKAVREALLDIMVEHGGLKPETAQKQQDKLLHQGRYVQELWG